MKISDIGFGCYRTGIGINEHYNSLSLALKSGINVIDTSSNYFDGGSEELVGKVLSELSGSGEIKRKNVLLVTKAGYIQGKNLNMASELESKGKLFPATVKLQERLWHCIHPEFLDHQIKLQLERLQQDYVDVYLLHNPEYFLLKAKEDGIDPDEANKEYCSRIKTAFEFLESKVKEGTILSYGISSNTFVESPDKYEFTSLEKITDIASEVSVSNHFSTVQFPLNLLESGAVSVLNYDSQKLTLPEFAKSKNLNVLINRPLNAISSKGLLRFADFNAEPFDEKEFIKKLKLVSLMEDDLINEKISNDNLSDDEKHFFKRKMNIGKLTEENWKFFGSIEHFNDSVSQIFAPKIDSILKSVNEKIKDENIKDFTGRYIKECYMLLNYVSRYYKLRAARRNSVIHNLINEYLDDKFHSLTLSQKTFLILKSVNGVDCVLAGLRKEEYVIDALKILNDNKISNAEKIIEHVSKEIEIANS